MLILNTPKWLAIIPYLQTKVWKRVMGIKLDKCKGLQHNGFYMDLTRYIHCLPSISRPRWCLNILHVKYLCHRNLLSSGIRVYHCPHTSQDSCCPTLHYPHSLYILTNFVGFCVTHALESVCNEEEIMSIINTLFTFEDCNK